MMVVEVEEPLVQVHQELALIQVVQVVQVPHLH